MRNQKALTSISGVSDHWRLAAIASVATSLSSWFLTLLTSRFVPGDNFGTISMVSPWFYVAIVALFVTFGIFWMAQVASWRPYAGLIVVIQTELLLSFQFIWGLGSQLPSYLPDSISYGLAASIGTRGGLSGLFPSPLPWPGVWIWASEFLNVLGKINANYFSLIVVWVFLASSSLLFFALMRRLFSGDVRLGALATVSFVVGAWTFTTVFNDVGFAGPLFILFLVLAFESSERLKMQPIIGMVLVVVSVIIANPYAAFSVLGVMGIYGVVGVVKRTYRIWLFVFVLSLVAFGSWYVISQPQLLAGFSPLLRRLFGVGSLVQQLSTKYVGSVTHRTVILAAESLSGLFVGLSALGVFMRHRLLGMESGRRVVLSVVGLGVALAVLGPAYGAGSSIVYSIVETIERSWVFGFVFVAFFITSLFGRRFGLVLLVVLLALTPVSVMASQGNYGWRPTLSEVIGGDYVQNHAHSVVVLQIDNYTSLDGLYCWHINCLYDFSSQYVTSKPGSGGTTGIAGSIGGVPTIVSYSTSNALLIEALTGSSAEYTQTWVALASLPAVDTVYSSSRIGVAYSSQT